MVKWLSERWLLFQGTQVRFPTPTWQLTICNSSSRKYQAGCGYYRNVYRHAHKPQIHMKQDKCLKLLKKHMQQNTHNLSHRQNRSSHLRLPFYISVCDCWRAHVFTGKALSSWNINLSFLLGLRAILHQHVHFV